MKKRLTLLWLMAVLTTVTAWAQKKYIVSDIDGQPKTKTKGAVRAMRKGEVLTDASWVSLAAKDQVDLLDMASQKIIILENITGSDALQKLIADKVKKANEKGASARYMQHILAQVRKDQTPQLHRVSDPATVTRDMEVVDSIASSCGFKYNQNTGEYDDFRSDYQKFREQAWKEYRDFRDEAWGEYVRYVRKAWKEIKREDPIPAPKEKEVAPIIMLSDDSDEAVELDENLSAELKMEYDKDENQTASFFTVFEKVKKKIKNKLKTIKGGRKKDAPSEEIAVERTVTIPPVKEEQPMPLAPVQPAEAPLPGKFTFELYGSKYTVRIGEGHKFKLKSASDNDVADALQALAADKYNDVLRDCLGNRAKYKLSDWAYFQFIKALCDQFLGEGNESTLLQAYLYSQSGYKMKLGRDGQRIVMLTASKHDIYNEGYYVIDGDRYYLLGPTPQSMQFCRASLPKEQGLSLLITEPQQFAEVESGQNYKSKKFPNVTVPLTTRGHQSKKYPDVDISIHPNKNLMEFYETYPTSKLNGDEMSRWAMYANTPLNENVRNELYPQLRSMLEGKSQYEQVERLLNLIQSDFNYAYDEKIWGKDRPFFAEETLFYPWCDCEDRAILLSRLVRDLVGLPTILIYYPGHLAMGVGFKAEDNVKGDYIALNGQHFTVCDPTILGAGAPPGRTMKGMDNKKATVILLEN